MECFAQKKLGYRFNRQVNIDDKYIVDFCCGSKKVIIELDGGQHLEDVKDKVRDNYLRRYGYRVLRFWNNEILGNMEGCLEKIVEVLKGC